MLVNGDARSIRHLVQQNAYIIAAAVRDSEIGAAISIEVR